MRTLLLFALSAGCMPHLPCRAGDTTCDEVSDALAGRRRNIGGWCGTPNMQARRLLEKVGPDAVPYLAYAFDDPDPEVAALALNVTVEVGCAHVVEAWCQNVRDAERLELCHHALARRTHRSPGACM